MTVRNRPKRGRRVLLCPQCGSANILPVAGMIVGQVYHCTKCDYVGSLVFETELDADGTPLPD
jgi:predicted RNA-binding Zn-ribbon protein involved in translation (DUF1610 family)